MKTRGWMFLNFDGISRNKSWIIFQEWFDFILKKQKLSTGEDQVATEYFIADEGDEVRFTSGAPCQSSASSWRRRLKSNLHSSPADWSRLNFRSDPQLPQWNFIGLTQWLSSFRAKETDVGMNVYSEKIFDLIAIEEEIVDIEKNEIMKSLKYQNGHLSILPPHNE